MQKGMKAAFTRETNIDSKTLQDLRGVKKQNDSISEKGMGAGYCCRVNGNRAY